MMCLHDTFASMKSQLSTLTERGQVSVPAALRRQMHLKPGQRLRWESVSETEARIVVEAAQPDPIAALGFGAKVRKGQNSQPRRTADWMKELRSGE